MPKNKNNQNNTNETEFELNVEEVEDQVEVVTEDSLDDAEVDFASEGDLSVKINKLEDELTKANDKLLRTLAELENTKRRSQKDLENAHKFAIESFLKSLLPVLDSFDGGRQSIPAEQKEALEGVNLIENSFLKVLEDFGVQIVKPTKGDDFDPDFHQAMTVVPTEEGGEANKIIESYQRGFAIKGRLVRAAMVVVSQ